MRRPYVRLSTAILDNPKIGMLSDHDWKMYVESIVRNPENIHYDHSDEPSERIEWNKIRKHITPQIFSRDGKFCKKCGSTEHLEIDHVVPIFHGGTSALDNLQVLCRHCNRTKRAKLEVASG
jgi:5-methylcytosine-specific restriction endonuclease McrA